MQDNVIKFPLAPVSQASARKPRVSQNDIAEQSEDLPADRELSATCKNLRLRQLRYDVWRKVDTQKDYWQVRMDFQDVLYRAQRDRIPDALSYPAVDHKDRWPLLEKYREALAKLLLTPAPTIGLVNWKKAINGRHEYTSVSSKRLERAIADDVAFLGAHPVRQSKKPVARS